MTETCIRLPLPGGLIFVLLPFDKPVVPDEQTTTAASFSPFTFVGLKCQCQENINIRTLINMYSV